MLSRICIIKRCSKIPNQIWGPGAHNLLYDKQISIMKGRFFSHSVVSIGFLPPNFYLNSRFFKGCE